jgi:SAM-dependent methyltransferase
MPKTTTDQNGEINARLTEIHRQVIERRVFYHSAYQPISVGSIKSEHSIRNSEDRWTMIKRGIDETDSQSLLDLGCAEGFFVRKAAEHRLFAIGVDIDAARLGLGESARMMDRQGNCGFVLGSIGADLLGRLPQFDAVICFSVMHHIIRKHGRDVALSQLSQMREITKRVFFFDMGQPDEGGKWRKVLSFMGDDPEGWIKSFLQEGGFTHCEKIGTTDAYCGGKTRNVFRCLVRA